MRVNQKKGSSAVSERERISGYVVKRQVELTRIRATFIELEHEATGARHLHIACEDRENSFGVAFKTVPRDSTGAAHILEHTVLCGSQRFPVRDPFFSMLKRSLSTFMNAFTAPDFTVYPFSTQNKKDFSNLMDVYLDATFFPKLEKLSFKQEGHRVEILKDIPGSHGFSLVYKGVVYNEMKGAMSSPDQVMVRSLMKALYPSATYQYNSGGDPLVITELTYDQLKAFHRDHYHPSNAFFYTYGNFPLEEHLAFISKTVLNRFDRIDPDTDVSRQPRWKHPKEARFTYPIGKHEDLSRKAQACMAWLVSDVREPFDVLVLTLLEQILLGNAASPVRKALMDSRLGTALCDGTGFTPDYRDPFFACGLKDVSESDVKSVGSTILDTISGLVNKGVDRDLIESAVHQLEFHRKEVTNHPYPYGIKLLMVFCGPWLHGGDPARILIFEEDLKTIRKEVENGAFFENTMKQFFLENPHRLLLTLSPDPLMEEKESREIRSRLDHFKNGLSPQMIEQIKADAEALLTLQESIEEVSSLPTLEIEDIPSDVTRVTHLPDDDRFALTRYDQPTAGIFYFIAAGGIREIDASLLPEIPFFCYAFSKIGTTRRNYADIATLIDRYAGGIGLGSHARTLFDSGGRCVPFVSFEGKCLNRNQEKVFDLMEELIFHFDFSDHIRLMSLLLEYKAHLESMIVHNGHRFAVSLASRKFSDTCSLSETWHGIFHLKKIKELTADLTETKLTSIAGDLRRIGKHLFSSKNIQMAFIGDRNALDLSVRRMIGSPGLSELVRDPSGNQRFTAPSITVESGNLREGWSTSSAVSFVAKVFKTVRMSHEDAPALSVIAKILKSLYLHREIREKGGAYGAYALYDSENGLFSFSTYRDPHIVETLNAFQNSAEFIRSGHYTEEDVKEAILQVCSEIDRPDPPGPAAKKAFMRRMVLLSDEKRQHFKERLLSINRAEVISVAEKYFQPDESRQAVAVISGEDLLKSAGQGLKDPLELHRI
ncbi:MAG: insulinase family protein [Pseudomonadota bacterium]